MSQEGICYDDQPGNQHQAQASTLPELQGLQLPMRTQVISTSHT